MAHSLEHMIPSWWQYLRRWRSCGLVERGVPPRVLQHWKHMYNIAQLPVYSLFFSSPQSKMVITQFPASDTIPVTYCCTSSLFWRMLILYNSKTKKNKLFNKLPCHDILLTGKGKVTNTEVGNREQFDALKRLIMMMWGFVCFFLLFLIFHYM